MFFLSRPNERQLWIAVAVVLATTFVLTFASLQFPWYTANHYPSDLQEIRGSFELEEWNLQTYSNERLGQERTFGYGDDEPMGDLMASTQGLMTFGVIGVGIFVGLVVLYYYGYLQETRWVKIAWFVGMVMLTFTVGYFSLRAGSAGAQQIQELLERQSTYDLDFFGTPESRFWGSQRYANGDLVSAPGVGWLLAVLAILNMAVGTVLLYQFPDEVADEEPELAEEGTGMQAREMETMTLS